MAGPLAISVGDPAGVGPEVVAEATSRMLAGDAALVFGDAGAMESLFRARGFDRLCKLGSAADAKLGPGEVGLVHVVDWPQQVVEARSPTAAGGEAQRRALEAAWDATLAGQARALVTGPVSKEAVDLSGTAFRGQTEHLAQRAGVDVDAVTMMFLGPRLKVALVSTHWSIVNVPKTITADRIQRATRHLTEALLRWDSSAAPLRIDVTGLNPHAGEGGLLGTEERDIIAPALTALRQEPPFCNGRVELSGPTPAEASFRFAADGALHGVVAMYHDQATIPSKLLDWGQAVNVTWGLPRVRASVDHGVAYDAAARGTASAEGMVAAIEAAQRLTTRDR